MQNRKVSMVQILNPQINRGQPPRPIRTADYIEVPRLSTHGTWRALDMLSDDSIRATLTAYKHMGGTHNSKVPTGSGKPRKV